MDFQLYHKKDCFHWEGFSDVSGKCVEFISNVVDNLKQLKLFSNISNISRLNEISFSRNSTNTTNTSDVNKKWLDQEKSQLNHICQICSEKLIEHEKANHFIYCFF